MATILERFKETSRQTFHHQSNPMDANDGRFPMVDQPAIKDEASQRHSCPFTNEGKQKEEEASKDDLVDEKVKDNLRTPLSPEFLMGSSEKVEEDGKTVEDPSEVTKKVTCVFCNENFEHESSLEEHTAKKHYAAGMKLYDCSVCQKRFTHRSSRDIHLRVHTGQRPYECEYCKKRFRVSSHLRDHVRTHTGERPFKCGVCGRGFKQSSDMKKHRKTHFKEVPAVSANIADASYMIVRPDDKSTSAGQHSSDLQSPTERQNLKLVIKRERKMTDNSTKNVSNNTTLPLEESIYSAKTISGKKTPPREKTLEVSSENMGTTEKTIQTNNLDANGNWAAGFCFSPENTVSTIKLNENLSKMSPGKMAVKRKLEKASKSLERNGYSSYPSMASGFGQIYSGVHLHQDCKNVEEPDKKQDNAQTYNSDSRTGNSRNEEFEKKLSYDDQTAIQKSTQNGEGNGSDEVFWQPQNKVIKTEKLSPNSHEQTANCGEVWTAHHGLATVSHEQQTNTYEQGAYNHEHAAYKRQHQSYDHEVSTGVHDRAYTHDWQTKSREDNMIDERAYNGEVATTVNKDLTNNQPTADYDMDSIDSVAQQQADDSNHVNAQALENTSTEIPEDDMESGPPSEVTSQPEAVGRKPMIVKLRRNKTGGTKAIRKPVKLKDDESDVQCSVCNQTFGNMEEFAAHKCGKNKSFKCTVCNKNFARQTLLRQHMVLHQGSKRFRFKCNYCGRAFRHRSHLRDHERIHTGERPFKCSFCPKAFKQSSDHRKHENLHTGTTRYRCEKCSLDFKRCDALKRHAMMHNKGEVTLLKCDKCRSLFATADGHMSHVCLNRPYRYRCQICPERFTHADDLRRHCYELHGEQSTLSCLKCEFCKLEFNTLEKLDEHLGTHRLKKTHRCRTCDQRFSLLNQLVEHVKTHSASSAGSVSALDQTEENKVEETCTVKNIQLKESSPNITVMNHTSNRPVFQRYDFIPSKYQPLISPTYHDMAVGNWMRSHNYYLPLRPKENGIPRRQSEFTPSLTRYQPISPRQQPISPKHQSISPRHYSSQNNPIPSRNTAEVSPKNPIPLQSNKESYRKDTELYRNDTELSENRPVTAEPGRKSAEFSENHLVSPRSQAEYHRVYTESLNPESSENSTNKSRPSSITASGEEYSQTSPKDLTDPFSSTSFAAYHAIALSRSSYRTPHGLQRDQKTNQHQSSRPEPTSSRPEPTSSRHDSNSRHDSTSSRHDSTSSRQDSTNVDVSQRPVVTLKVNKTCTENESTVVTPENNRRYSDDVRLQTEAVRWGSDQTSTTHKDVRRNSDGVRITPERNKSKCDGIEVGHENIQVNLTRSRNNSTTSQNDTADEHDLSRSYRKNNERNIKRKYTCLNCRAEFYHENSLVDHVCYIFSEILYSCLVCKDDFEKYEDLQEHMRKHWKQMVYYKCTLCGVGLRSEELLKKHNLKHIQNIQAEQNESLESEEDENRKTVSDKAQYDPSDSFITPRGPAKSLTSPVICSVNGNVVTKRTSSERGYNERRSSNTDIDPSPKTGLTNESAYAVPNDVSPVSYLPYYEARKQAAGYVNVFGQSQAMVVSTIQAAMETGGRYHVPNGLLYAPTMSRSEYTVEPH